jgi:muramoyltetrapeptide carboxypeptidase LdcA involved in peptidoglycan recycling
MDNISSWIWVMVPVGAFALAAFKRWARLKERQLEVQTNQTAEKTAQYAAHTERLEQRMRVLERIITDKGMEISDEIESLLDRPLN